MRHRQASTVLLSLALSVAGSGLVHAEDDGTTTAVIQRMEREQEALLRKLKRDIQNMDDSPRKEELKARIEAVEARVRAPRNLYVSPSSKLTPPMKTYYEAMRRRLEDCGTRHFPTREGRKVHGQSTVGITLDRDGRLLKSEILEGSGNRIIDRHIPRIVAATAPFGRVPDLIVTDQAGSYTNLVVVTRFDFSHNEGPSPHELPDAERCRWK